MPPKKKNQSKDLAKDLDLCCVCCQPIKKGRDELLFCDGDCKQWLHRYCAGVSTSCFKAISEKGDPFYCYACCLSRHRREIDALKDSVELLKGEIADLKSSPSATSQAQPPISSDSDLNFAPRTKIAHDLEDRSQQRKYNVVLYGIDECPNGTSKSQRLEREVGSAVSVLSGLDKSITPHSIKDIFRLGKYSNVRKHPRPLLIKFIRVADASSILSKRGSSHGSRIVIKPDMSPTERKSESLLLKERWSLLQSGVPRDAVKIRGSRLLVRNKPYGEVQKSGSTLSFVLHNSTVCNAVHTSSPIVLQSSTTSPHLSPSPDTLIAHSNTNAHSHRPSTPVHSSSAPRPLSSPTPVSDK